MVIIVVDTLTLLFCRPSCKITIKMTGTTAITASATLCLKNDTVLACCNFDVHQLILIICGRNVTNRTGSQIMIYFSTLSK